MAERPSWPCLLLGLVGSGWLFNNQIFLMGWLKEDCVRAFVVLGRDSGIDKAAAERA